MKIDQKVLFEELPSITKVFEQEERVRNEILSNIEGDLDSLLSWLDLCESPIEKLMYIALQRKLMITRYIDDDFKYWRITPQKQIGPYRVDFLVQADIANKYRISVAVECDGHEFHEKTKEQAAKDKARDRQFLLHRCPLLRFTGSEIWRDPWKCADEVVETLKSWAGSKGAK